MRYILYPILLAALISFPCVVLGITAHFQSYSLLYWHKLQGPFSYVIAIACLTIAGALAHLACLILDLEASYSGVGFRKTVAEAELPIALWLIPFWIAVAIVVGTKTRMDRIGGCGSKPPTGYVVEPNPRLCTEWAISTGFAAGTTVVLIAWVIITRMGLGRNAFVAHVWRRRQQKANRARGVVPPRALLPAGATQPLPTAPPPALTIPAAAPAAAMNPPHIALENPFDIEGTAGYNHHTPQEASSDPMTSPASPPPSALPSWIQPSTIPSAANGQVQLPMAPRLGGIP